MGFGRLGDRVANTPIRRLPPRRGGRTVGDQPPCGGAENSQSSQICETDSSPRNASRTRYSGSNTTRPVSAEPGALWRGRPNFVGKSV